MYERLRFEVQQAISRIQDVVPDRLEWSEVFHTESQVRLKDWSGVVGDTAFQEDVVPLGVNEAQQGSEGEEIAGRTKCLSPYQAQTGSDTLDS